MGTEILRPQDCLINPGPSLFARRRFIPCRNPNPSRNFRKASFPESKRWRDGSLKPAKPQSQPQKLVMGQVTILKSGVSLDGRTTIKDVSDADGALDAAVFGTGRLGPEPAMMPKQIRLISVGSGSGSNENGFAGSAFSMSPSPRSLPLPSFWRREKISTEVVDQPATMVLRRLLRLE